jgi:hypothetical protein
MNGVLVIPKCEPSFFIFKIGGFGGFQLPEVRKKNSKNRQISISCFSVYSQKCGRRSKDLYFIFGLLKIFFDKNGIPRSKHNFVTGSQAA